MDELTGGSYQDESNPEDLHRIVEKIATKLHSAPGLITEFKSRDIAVWVDLDPRSPEFIEIRRLMAQHPEITWRGKGRGRYYRSTRNRASLPIECIAFFFSHLNRIERTIFGYGFDAECEVVTKYLLDFHVFLEESPPTLDVNDLGGFLFGCYGDSSQSKLPIQMEDHITLAHQLRKILKRTVETHKSHYHVSDQLQFVVKYYGRPKEVDEPPNKDKHILSYYSLKNLSMNRTQIKNSVSRIEGHARVKAIASLTRREVRSHLMKTNSMLTAYWDENQREVPPNPEVHLRNFADLIGCFKLEEAGDERNT